MGGMERGAEPRGRLVCSRKRGFAMVSGPFGSSLHIPGSPLLTPLLLALGVSFNTVRRFTSQKCKKLGKIFQVTGLKGPGR